MLGLKYKIVVFILVYVSAILCAPSESPDAPSLVVSTTESSTEATTEGQKENEVAPTVPKIYSMKVVSDIANRFATTKITSKVKNLGKTAQETTFSIILPESAYISGFVMEIGGKNYTAYVKEKEEAKKIYEEARQSGIAAGHVEANARDSNRFTVSVNIEPQSKATFYLTYEELIKRQKGQYEVVINIHPGQPVKDLGVEVNINETRPLVFVKQAPFLRSGNEISKNNDKVDAKAVIEKLNKTSAKVTFNPDIEKQKEFANKLGTKEESGLAGQFVVQYDVERDPFGGEVLVSDGYFVHFFAPSDLPPLKKHVVFVLDTSGSMYGTRIEQLKTAMESILSELKKEDTFNIVDFNSDIFAWNVTDKRVQFEKRDHQYSWYENDRPRANKTEELPGAFEASEQNVEKAKEIVRGFTANGGTNIKSALEVALQLIRKAKDDNKNLNQPIIIFLTDGEATVGEVDNDKIISTISELNSGLAPIFSLSFGDGADRSFLQKISLKNQGFARHIYEAADASLQLEEFYKQISSPLLSNVKFNYVSKDVEKVTKTIFPIWFEGSELIVAGRIIDPGFYPPSVTGNGLRGPIKLQAKVENPVGSLERLWAYLMVQQIMDARDAAEKKEVYTKKALEIALKYSFVTPVSSLVVVKPNDTKAEANTEDASKSRPIYPGAARPLYANFGAPMSASGFSLKTADYAPSVDFEDAVEESYATTSLSLSTSTTEIDALTKLKSELPWLRDVLHDNGTLSLPLGNYELGLDASVDVHPECSQPLSQEKGTCQLLKDCPQIYPSLNSTAVYVSHFCALTQYAGVCCPTLTSTTATSTTV